MHIFMGMECLIENDKSVHGGVAQWQHIRPRNGKLSVRIPPGCKVSREIIAMLLFKSDT
jgi:hypothetical protein